MDAWGWGLGGILTHAESGTVVSLGAGVVRALGGNQTGRQGGETGLDDQGPSR